MKKLMMAVAIVCVAVGVQAGTYNWNASGSAYYESSGSYDEFDGYTVYAFDTQTISLADLSSALSTTGTDALNDALGSGTVSGFEYAFQGSGIQGVGSPEYINAYLVLVDADEGYFATASLDPIKVTDTVASSGAPLSADFVLDMPGEGAAGWTKIAPEPTSGLMLLLGMGVLALRRRRA